MNVNTKSLGVFIPGQVNQQSLTTPFSGMGDFVPSSFTVPFNPIYNASTAPGGLGYFMDACFPVPQTPIADAANIIPAIAVGGAGMGCASCGGGCGARGAGMGDASGFFTSLLNGDVSGAATNSDFISGVPNIVVVGVAVYFTFSLIGDTKRATGRARALPGAVRKRTSAARAAYQAALT